MLKFYLARYALSGEPPIIGRLFRLARSLEDSEDRTDCCRGQAQAADSSR